MVRFFRRGHGLFLDRHTDVDGPVDEIPRGQVHALSGEERVSAAYRLCLAGHRNIPVTDETGTQFLGMLTSRTLLDYLGGGSMHQKYRARKHALKARSRGFIETGHFKLERKRSVRNALHAMKRTGEEAIPLMEKGKLNGMLTELDMVSLLAGKTGVRAREIMTSKPVVVRNRHPVCDVARMLVKGGYSRLPVVRDSFLVGIVTPHDIISYLNESKKMSSLKRDRTEAEKAMNASVVSIGPEEDVFAAARVMREKGVSMLPVVDHYQLIGVLTARDIVDAM